VVFAYLTLPKAYRTQNLRYDFDFCGEIRKDRVPVGPTIRLTVDNIEYVPVYKDTYVLTGGHNDSGWLLGDSYPSGADLNAERITTWFRAGLVIASPDLVSSPPPDGLDVTFQNPPPEQHEQPRQGRRAAVANAWEYGKK
jgi:hypothetical protein